MKRLFTSCFGLGFLPVAPGTWGSAPVAAIFAVMCFLGAGAVVTSAVMVAITLAASWACVAFAPSVIELSGSKDPSEVVADEAAGQAVTFIAAYAAGAKEICIVTVIGFFAFRLFDIIKPYPCRKLENLPAGVGILADDLMAGLYAAIIVQICIRLWIS